MIVRIMNSTARDLTLASVNYTRRTRKMLRPKVNVKEFEKFGFKKCKGDYGKQDCYYLCVSRGIEMIFVSPLCYMINPWKEDDPRIHARANCRYKDSRTALDITFEIIKADMLEEDRYA